jgi:AraC family transcriptional regulator
VLTKFLANERKMPGIIPNRDTENHMPSQRLFASDTVHWESLLVQGYLDPPLAETFSTAATPDLLIVLITTGVYRIGARHGKRWDEALYRPGSIGMTAPERQSTLRWRSESATQMTSLHVHIPSTLLIRTIEENWGTDPARFDMPDALNITDPLLTAMCRALSYAIDAGAGEFYAESAAQFLATHVLSRHCGLPGGMLRASKTPRLDDRRLRNAASYMQERFGDAITLDVLAKKATMSRFHFLRLFKNATGMTPHTYLVRLRLQRARMLLADGRDSVGGISVACGFESPAHFAAVFRRDVGMSPSEYRKICRSR